MRRSHKQFRCYICPIFIGTLCTYTTDMLTVWKICRVITYFNTFNDFNKSYNVTAYFLYYKVNHSHLHILKFGVIQNWISFSFFFNGTNMYSRNTFNTYIFFSKIKLPLCSLLNVSIIRGISAPIVLFGGIECYIKPQFELHDVPISLELIKRAGPYKVLHVWQDRVTIAVKYMTQCR